MSIFGFLCIGEIGIVLIVWKNYDSNGILKMWWFIIKCIGWCMNVFIIMVLMKFMWL